MLSHNGRSRTIAILGVIALGVGMLSITQRERAAEMQTPASMAGKAQGNVWDAAQAGVPPISDQTIVDFVIEAFPRTMRIVHPTTLEQHMAPLRPLYTKEGFDAQSKALYSARIIEMGSDVSAAIIARPVVEKSGQVDGKWTWVVSFPADMTFKKDGRARVEAWKATLVLEEQKSNPPAALIRQTVIVSR